jgi:hypothetical protein
MSPYVISVIFILALLFILLSLAPFLANSSDADALDRFPNAETNPASLSR